MSEPATILATQVDKAKRKKKERLENKCNLSLQLSRIANKSKMVCGGFRWSEDSKIALGACIEGIGADLLIESVNKAPSNAKSLPAKLIVKALKEDAAARKLFKKAAFNIIKPKTKRSVKGKQGPKIEIKEKKVKRKAKKAEPVQSSQVV